MSQRSTPPRHIAVASHPQLPEAIHKAAQIAAELQAHGVDADYGLLYDESLTGRLQRGDFDLMVALGGDGTMLRAGHRCGPLGVPILGINLGRFGFLSEVQPEDWPSVMERLLDGDFWIEHRMMLVAEHHREGQSLGAWEVVNEVVVTRGQMVRPVRLVTHVDGYYLTTYVADALIAATPTGSTAYALAAGGPILPPEVRNILLLAVAPHLTLDRAIVLSEGSSVSIEVHTDHEAVLSVDGQAPVALAVGDRVEARASAHTLKFIRFQQPGYFYRNIIQHMNQNPSTGALR